MAAGPIAVLIIEDEPAIRRFLRVSLAESGYRVIEAGSGQQAMRRLRLDRPDIIILDLGLPDVDGLDIIREVWKVPTDVRYLRIYIKQLRHKIEPDPQQPRYILTETGVGYRLRAPD